MLWFLSISFVCIRKMLLFFRNSFQAIWSIVRPNFLLKFFGTVFPGSRNQSFAFLQWFSILINFVFFSLTIFQRICVRHRYRSSVQNSRNHQIELITSVSVFSWTYFWKKYSNPFVVDVVWNRIGFFHFSQFFICVGTWTIRNHKSNLFAAPRNGYAVA